MSAWALERLIITIKDLLVTAAIVCLWVLIDGHYTMKGWLTFALAVCYLDWRTKGAE